jgi:hypothetical protein
MPLVIQQNLFLVISKNFVFANAIQHISEDLLIMQLRDIPQANWTETQTKYASNYINNVLEIVSILFNYKTKFSMELFNYLCLNSI